MKFFIVVSTMFGFLAPAATLAGEIDCSKLVNDGSKGALACEKLSGDAKAKCQADVAAAGKSSLTPK